MTTEQIQERVKNIFADLEQLCKTAQPEPSSFDLEGEGEECGPIPITGDVPAEDHCPFLQSYWDRSVRYGYPSWENLCYKNRQPWSVPLAKQQQTCLSGTHHDCQGNATGKQNGKLTRIFGGLFSKEG